MVHNIQEDIDVLEEVFPGMCLESMMRRFVKLFYQVTIKATSLAFSLYVYLKDLRHFRIHVQEWGLSSHLFNLMNKRLTKRQR